MLTMMDRGYETSPEVPSESQDATFSVVRCASLSASPNRKRSSCGGIGSTITTVDGNVLLKRQCRTSPTDVIPDAIVANIFSFLGIKRLKTAMLVCRRWYKCAKIPCVWVNRWFNINSIVAVARLSSLEYLRTGVSNVMIGLGVPLTAVATAFQNITSVSFSNGLSPNDVDIMCKCMKCLKFVRVYTVPLMRKKKVIEDFDITALPGVTGIELCLSGKTHCLPKFNSKKLDLLAITMAERPKDDCISATIATCASLSRLGLSNVTVDWKFLESLKGLQSLVICDCSPMFTLSIHPMPSVRTLRTGRVECFDFSRLSRAFPNIVEFSCDLSGLENSCLDKSIAGDLSADARCTQLEKINVTLNEWPMAFTHAVCDMPNLRTLSITSDSFVYDKAEPLFNSKNISRIIFKIGAKSNVSLVSASDTLALIQSIAKTRIMEKTLLCELFILRAQSFDGQNNWGSLSAIASNVGIRFSYTLTVM